MNSIVSFLSLKVILVGCLEAILFSACEDNPLHFILPLHTAASQKPAFRKILLKRPIHWRNIPIEQKQASGSILYTSALPHIIAKEAEAFRHTTLSEISDHLVNQLNQSPLGQLNSDLDHDDGLLFFVLQLWSEFKIETRRPGWLALHLSNRGIDLWIQHHQKVFQTNHKHTQLLLNYGYLSQMSYSLFKSVDHTDRDHNNATFNLSDQRRNQSTSPPHLSDLFKQSPPANASSNQGFTGPEPSHHALSHQKTGTQLIPPEPTSHRNVAGQNLPAQQALTPKQGQLAETWLWQVQYTYARCCAVMQRWESIPADPSKKKASTQKASTTQSAQPGVSIDTSPKRGSSSQPMPSPQPSNWAKPSENQATGNRLEHERQTQQLITQQLIASLIEVTDNLFWIPYRWPSQQYFLLLKSSNHLYQAFEAFSSHCLVGFGQISQVDVPREGLGAPAPDQGRFQTRVDLVIATQSILKGLLEGYLDAPAPTEL